MKYLTSGLIFITLLLAGCATDIDPARLPARVFQSEHKYNPQGENTFFKVTSPIELRSIQSRKINKTVSQINLAMNTSCRDRSGQGQFLGLNGNCVLPVEMKSEYTSRYIGTDYLDRDIPLSISFRYEMTPSQDQKSTVIRIRGTFFAYGLKREQENRQITFAPIYREEFKKIAEALFIEATELSPEDMN